MSENLGTYLNDHVAGSVLALELLDHLIDLPEAPDRKLLTRLRIEIQEDQEVLQQLLRTVGAKESTVRKAAAWLTEKLGRAKLRMDDSGSGELRVLEGLESLALGIQGKLALWRSLATLGDAVPPLKTLDLARLQARAVEQFESVERLRLQAARRTLSS
ncbi:MAG: hypothetical protein ACJ8A6_04135 [Gemmatimonadales bacterium]